MKVIPPDLSRLIDLPGVGPTPRPVDVDQALTGFRTLKSLRVYDFSPGPAIAGEAEGDEVLVVVLAGAATFEVSGEHAATFDLSVGGDRAAYLPPHHAYRLTPRGGATVAYARAEPARAAEPRAFARRGSHLHVDAHFDRLRLCLLPLDAAADACGSLDPGTERLVHLTAPARVLMGGQSVSLERARTLALAPGETAHVAPEGGGGEMLVVGAA